MKVILCGYNWTGCKALELLLNNGHNVYVYTHSTENSISDLEGLCMKWSVPYSLEKISTSNFPFDPDVICSIYYRYIISREVIRAVNGKIFNLHPSLLPKYRGCSSLTWAMINGESECGYTYHYIDSGCDTGDIICQKKIAIEDFDTQLTLYNRVMFEAMGDFLDVLNFVQCGKMGKRQQGESSFYKRGCPYGGIMKEDMTEHEKERFVRAMIYPPYPPAEYKGEQIRTYKELQEIVDV